MLCVVTSLTLGIGLSTPPANHGRKLSQTAVGKYTPLTSVIDHANIDLDQKALEDAFGSSEPYDFNAVLAAWEGQGPDAGHSKPHVTCVITGTAGQTFAADDTVEYTDIDGNTVEGTAKAACTSGQACTFDITLAKAANFADALNKKNRIDVTADIVDKSSGNAIGKCGTVTYYGNRSLKGFSSKAKDLMYSTASQGATCPDNDATVTYPNGCPYTSYKPYFDYYCSSTSACNSLGDYVDVHIQAGVAANAMSTANSNQLSHFNIDFSQGPGNYDAFRQDFIKKISKFSSAWMYAIREFEDAIDDCVVGDLARNAISGTNGYRDDVHAWDEGVAFYVGGQTTGFYETSGANKGDEIAPGNTYLAYTLANKRCKNFKTCGRNGDLVEGEAFVNFELWKLFNEGRDTLLAGNCGGAVPIKNEIVKLMTVPLVQGTLRYLKYCSTGVTCTSKALGELAAFSHGLLPQLHASDPAVATLLETAANPSSYTCATSSSCTGPTKFAELKTAIESTYSDLGITCEQVGGLWDSANNQYYPGKEPCTTGGGGGSSSDSTIGIAVGCAVGGLALLSVIFLIMKERAGTPIFTPMATPQGKAQA